MKIKYLILAVLLKRQIKIKGEIPDVSNLATKTALTTVENKILNVSRLATKAELTAIEN